METKFELKDDEYIKDGIPYCKKCNTARYFVDGDFCVSCQCKCQIENNEKLNKETKMIEEQKRLLSLKENSLLSKRYKDCNFDKINVINEAHMTIISRLKKYCDKFKGNGNGLGIYLYGNTGSGKTLLTACMLNNLNSQYIECLFTNMFKLRQELFSADIKKQKEFIDKVIKVPVLFIDDFGTESVKKNGEDNYLQDLMYDIINSRYNNMLPIIYTSNYSLRECLEERGILKKTIDRIYETTVQIKLDIPSYRLREKENIYF